MGPRVFLSGPNASGLEAQVLGPYPNETFPQAGRETIQVTRAADVQRPLRNQHEFRCGVGIRRYYHLVVEDLQIRRVTTISVLSAKEIGKIEENGDSLPECSKTTLANTLIPSYVRRWPLF